jgi:hypothetical protein
MDGFIVIGGTLLWRRDRVTLTRALSDLTVNRMRAAVAQAAHQNAAKSAFIANVTHEPRSTA